MALNKRKPQRPATPVKKRRPEGTKAAPAAPKKRRVNLKKIREQAAKSKQGANTTYTLQAGKSTVRFLPAPGTDAFFVVRKESYIPSGDAQGKKMFCISPQTIDPGEYCPAAAAAQALDALGDTERASEIRPKTQYLSAALVKGPGETSWSPVIIKYGKTVFEPLAEYCIENSECDEDEDFAELDVITDPKEAVAFTISRTGKGLATKYTVTPSKRRPLTKDELAHIPDLAAEVVPTPVEKMEAAICDWLEIGSIDDLIGEDARAADDDVEYEDEEFDEDDVEYEDDDEEADEDEEFDEDDEEEEEEEEPVRPPRRKRAPAIGKRRR
jgi:hypothetical protein